MAEVDGGPDAGGGLAQRLKREFFQALELGPDLGVHALLDRNSAVAAEHPLHRDRLADRLERRRIVTVPRPDFAHDPTICPFLVTLRAANDHGYPDEPLFDEIATFGWEHGDAIGGAYVAGWLLSGASAEALAGHLAAAMAMADPIQAQRRTLPFFEPHRLALLGQSQLLSTDAGLGARLLGPVQRWFHLGLDRACRSVGPFTATARSATATLPRGAWQAQHRVPMARQVAFALRSSGAVMPLDTELAIDKSLQAATAQGVVRGEDVLFFCLNCFTVDPRWFEAREAQEAIRAARETGQPLTDVFRALPDEQLDRIARGNDEPRRP